MTPTEEFDQLAVELINDSDQDVSVMDNSLVVAGQKFAYLDGASLMVRLTPKRGMDLASRGVAEPVPASSRHAEQWVRIFDKEDWSELAREAHGFGQAHRPGGES